MDPISAAGIGLSVASLALQVFSGCLKGYQIFTETADLPASYQHLRTRLRIEQSRHLNWGEQIGLLEESLELPSQVLRLHRNLILDILLEVNNAFASTLSITSKYNQLVPDEVPLSKQASLKQVMFLEKARAYWRTPGRVVTRLQWAMIKQEKFEALIVRLVTYNDAMESILDRNSLEDLRVMQERSNLILLQLTEQVAQLHTLTKALEIKPSPSIAVTNVVLQSSQSTAASEPSAHLDTLAAFKIQNIVLSQNTASRNMFIELNKIDLDEDEEEDDRSMAKLEDKRVFIEWRTPLDSEMSAVVKDVIETRLSQLALLLYRPDKPVEFRCPHCIGCCQRDNDGDVQYGLIFEIPSIEKFVPTIQTLKDSLTIFRPPPLTTRIVLANALVESLLYLHAVNWLHKGFRSDNIIFTPPEKSSTSGQTDLKNPLISGFDFSRPDTLDEVTVKSRSQLRHDFYKHPQLLLHSNSRSQKTHDIYALGVVLVEISLWKPIEAIMAVILKKPLSRSQLHTVRDRLLADPYEEFPNVIAAIAAQTGEVYANVVKRCIEGGQSLGLNPNDDQADPVVSATLQTVFFDQVYLKLKSIRI